MLQRSCAWDTWELLSPVNKFLFPAIALSETSRAEDFHEDDHWISGPVEHLRIFPSARIRKAKEAQQEQVKWDREEAEAKAREKEEKEREKEKEKDKSNENKGEAKLKSSKEKENDDSDTDEEPLLVLTEEEMKTRREKFKEMERKKRRRDHTIKVNRICIFLHSHWSTLRTEVARARWLADKLDCAVLAIEYPGYSRSSWRERARSTTGRLRDCVVRLLQFLTIKRKVPLENILLCGEGLGAGVMALVVRDYPGVGGFIPLNAFPSLSEFLSKGLQGTIGSVELWIKDNLPSLANFLKKIPRFPLMVERMPLEAIITKCSRDTPMVPLLDLPGTVPFLDLPGTVGEETAKLMRHYHSRLSKAAQKSLYLGAEEFRSRPISTFKIQVENEEIEEEEDEEDEKAEKEEKEEKGEKGNREDSKGKGSREKSETEKKVVTKIRLKARKKRPKSLLGDFLESYDYHASSFRSSSPMPQKLWWRNTTLKEKYKAQVTEVKNEKGGKGKMTTTYTIIDEDESDARWESSKAALNADICLIGIFLGTFVGAMVLLLVLLSRERRAQELVVERFQKIKRELTYLGKEVQDKSVHKLGSESRRLPQLDQVRSRHSSPIPPEGSYFTLRDSERRRFGDPARDHHEWDTQREERGRGGWGPRMRGSEEMEVGFYAPQRREERGYRPQPHGGGWTRSSRVAHDPYSFNSYDRSYMPWEPRMTEEY